MQKDNNGVVIPYDDTSISAQSHIIRGIPPHHIVDGQNGRKKISSAALDPSSIDRDPYQGLSIDIKDKIEQSGLNPVNIFKERSEFVGVIYLEAQSFRSRNLLVGSEPLPDNPFHGAVWETTTGKLTRSVKKALLREAGWLIAVDNTDII